MRLLVDSHVVFWVMSGERRLTEVATALLDDPTN